MYMLSISTCARMVRTFQVTSLYTLLIIRSKRHPVCNLVAVLSMYGVWL